MLATLAIGATSCVGRANEVTVSEAAPAPALAALLERLGRHAAQFEEMKRRGSFTLSGWLEELDRHGHVDGTKEMVVRVTVTPAEHLTEIVRYLEDGADKTADARKKAEKRRPRGSARSRRDARRASP